MAVSNKQSYMVVVTELPHEGLLSGQGLPACDRTALCLLLVYGGHRHLSQCRLQAQDVYHRSCSCINSIRLC